MINAERHPNARVVASIEARMGSSRLPGKVLADICGQPALSRLLDRLRQCRRLDDVVLATSRAGEDDALEAWAAAQGLAAYRGSEDDVLSRVVEAQQAMSAEIVVEITGDCPLLDPDVIDLGIESFFANEADVVNNFQTPSFAQGIDVQVFRLADLTEVECTVDDPAVREHVSLYFYEHPERYRILTLLAPPCYREPELRCQLDYPEDLRFITELYRRLEPDHGGVFRFDKIQALLRREPELREINRHCEEAAVR
jgi:spore coat polysaccharide biosynthesis protein SpsF